MAGCRSLTDAEINLVLALDHSKRDQCLFLLGLKAGFRISELLSLDVKDVYQAGTVLDRVKVAKKSMKGKSKSREVALHATAKVAVGALINSIINLDPASPLFVSQKGGRLSRFGAHVMLKKAFKAAGLTGCLATHTMRKSFAKKVYSNLKHDLLATRDALGHSDVSTTVKYLETNQELIDTAILSA